MPPGSKPMPPGTSNRQRAEWHYAAGVGWQHGPIPKAPAGLSAEGRKAWAAWMRSWWAGFYVPEDLPGLELLARLFDRCLAGDLDVTKITPLFNQYGMTPKARIDLRWAPPADMPVEAEPVDVLDEIAERRQSRRTKLA